MLLTWSPLFKVGSKSSPHLLWPVTQWEKTGCRWWIMILWNQILHDEIPCHGCSFKFAFFFSRVTLQKGLAAVHFASVQGLQALQGSEDHKHWRYHSLVTPFYPMGFDWCSWSWYWGAGFAAFACCNYFGTLVWILWYMSQIRRA